MNSYPSMFGNLLLSQFHLFWRGKSKKSLIVAQLKREDNDISASEIHWLHLQIKKTIDLWKAVSLSDKYATVEQDLIGREMLVIKMIAIS